MAAKPEEALTGAAHNLANAGYAPMKDSDRKQQDEPIGHAERDYARATAADRAATEASRQIHEAG
jgi:hypothetical protein